jgi:hypothetical protein
MEIATPTSARGMKNNNTMRVSGLTTGFFYFFPPRRGQMRKKFAIQ